MNIPVKTAVLAAAVLFLVSCNFMHDDEVVAVAQGRKLYRSQVLKYIPHGLDEKDSLALADQYIRSWAAELIMNAMADQQLSKQEKDVTSELEEYRNALLKYRYEQKYIADHLDTTVTDAQIEEHFAANRDLYVLTVPLVRARYLRIPAASSMKDDLLELLEGRNEDSLSQLDSLSATYANKYVDYGDRWLDMVELAREFGMDYGSLLEVRRGSLIDITDDQGTDHIAWITDYIKTGSIPPISYCRDRIREVIVSQRKYALSMALEQDMLDQALKTGNFVIYGKKD